VAGQSTNYALQLALTGGTGSINVTISCTGAPAKASCTGPAAPVIVSGSTPIMALLSLAFWTAVNSKVRVKAAVAWSAITSVSGRKFAYLAPSLVLLAAMTVMGGCGGGGGTPPPPPPPPVNGTPAGTYTLTVTATSGNVTHTQALTLTVQ
jgi:hypothetical protein